MSSFRSSEPINIETLDGNPLVIAAAVIGICAYPEDLKVGGKAHRMREAQLSWMQRRARLEHALPLSHWALTKQQQDNTLEAGLRRLDYAVVSHTLFTAQLLRSIKTPMLGGLTNISLDFGADLDRAIFRFGPHIPKPGPATINSALLHHRAAFGRPFGDPDETIKNLRRRYFYRYLSIAHLFWPLINQAHRVADEARSRGWSPFALLVSKPEWAAGFLRTAEDFEQIVPTLMLELGVGGFAVEHLVRVRAASP